MHKISIQATISYLSTRCKIRQNLMYEPMLLTALDIDTQSNIAYDVHSHHYLTYLIYLTFLQQVMDLISHNTIVFLVSYYTVVTVILINILLRMNRSDSSYLMCTITFLPKIM